MRVTSDASPEQIRRAIEQIVREPRFRNGAQRFENALAGEDGTERAARELESLGGTGHSPEPSPQAH
jgi:UDP:flavonoid glycosyltransferase YjiC (YdhE family)